MFEDIVSFIKSGAVTEASLNGVQNGRDWKTYPSVHGGPGADSIGEAEFRAHFAAQDAKQQARLQALSQETEKPVRYTGIELGEVEAWRIWRVMENRLVSAAVDTVWIAGEPISGKPQPGAHRGVHAFKAAQEACEQYEVLEAGKPRAPRVSWEEKMELPVNPTLALGKILLWGEVIEFEKGYRAEHGQVLELREIFPADETQMLEMLKADYDLKADGQGHS